MSKILMICFVLITLACAKVSVETAKPIKVDINMRVDIYQHVEQDVDSIMDDIYGEGQTQLNAIFGTVEVYAADFPPAVEEAKERIKARLGEVEDYFAKGYIGEDKQARLQLVGETALDIKGKVETVVAEENNDREVLYQGVADKNGAEVSRVRKIFFDKHYEKAAAGWLFEIYDEAAGRYIWKKK